MRAELTWRTAYRRLQMGPAGRGPKSSLQLYKDCLRLVKHLAGASVRAVVRVVWCAPHPMSFPCNCVIPSAFLVLGSLQSPKAVLLRGIIQKQFRDNMFESDQEKIHRMKQAYVGAHAAVVVVGVLRPAAHRCDDCDALVAFCCCVQCRAVPQQLSVI